MEIDYFRKQVLELFLDKLKAQGWLELFTNTQRGCSISDLAEFYVNCAVTQGVVTSTMNGHKLNFNAKELGEILGVSVSTCRTIRLCLGAERLL